MLPFKTSFWAMEQPLVIGKLKCYSTKKQFLMLTFKISDEQIQIIIEFGTAKLIIT